MRIAVLTRDHIKVSDLLGLNADARESTPLAPLVNRALKRGACRYRRASSARAMDALGTVNLLADSEALDRLTADGTLTTRQRDDLVSAAVFAKVDGRQLRGGDPGPAQHPRSNGERFG